MPNIIKIIKNLPMQNHNKIGFAVCYSDIYCTLKNYGFDNTDILNAELEKLESANIIELFRMDDFDEDLIYAVRLK